MVKDTFNSILDNIKERTTNPFLGTLVVVWLFKNWKLVYSLIYFDTKLTLQDRLKYIEVYFKDTSFTWNLIHTIFLTIGILVVTYLLLSLSRLLSDTYERILLPLISKWTDQSSIVLKTDYQKVIEQVAQLEEKLEKERLSKAELKSQRDSIDERYVKLLAEAGTDSKEDDIDTSAYRSVSNDFKMKGFDDVVDKVLYDIEAGFPIEKGLPVVQDLLDNDYIYVRGSEDKEKAFFGFTEEGELFKHYWDRVSQ